MSSSHSSDCPFVLVVEDNPWDVNLLRLALDKAGASYELHVIDDGGDALNFFRQSLQAESPFPSLIILDLNLPKYDGVEILEVIRANPEYNEVPVAFFTSSSSPYERTRIEGFRIGRYITKPADLEGFYRVGVQLKEILNRSTAATADGK